jgi:hypothetical protein
MPKYTVKSPIKDADGRHEIDAVVDLDDKAAKPLLDEGVIEPFVEAKPSNTGNAGPTDPVERIEAIKAAIAGLDKDDKRAWTKDGRPNLDALSEAAGFRVTAAERDQAFIELQPDAPTE